MRAAEVVTEFDQDITAKTVRVHPKPGENKRPHTLTRIYDGGVEVGEVAWVPSQKLLMWNFKGLTKGSRHRGDAEENAVGRLDVPADRWPGRTCRRSRSTPSTRGWRRPAPCRWPETIASRAVLATAARTRSSSPVSRTRRVRRPALAGRIGVPAVLRRPRSLLRQGRLQSVFVVVAAVDVVGLYRLQHPGRLLLLLDVSRSQPAPAYTCRRPARGDNPMKTVPGLALLGGVAAAAVQPLTPTGWWLNSGRGVAITAHRAGRCWRRLSPLVRSKRPVAFA